MGERENEHFIDNQKLKMLTISLLRSQIRNHLYIDIGTWCTRTLLEMKEIYTDYILNIWKVISTYSSMLVLLTWCKWMSSYYIETCFRLRGALLLWNRTCAK